MLAHSSNAATITLQVEQVTSRDATNAEGLRVGSPAAHAIMDALDKLEKSAQGSCLRDGGPTSKMRDDEVKCGTTSNIEF
jgi:hypothetical protein